MKAVKVTLPRDLQSIELHTFSDWHIGDKGCDIAAIKKHIAEVAEKKNAFCVLNGDLINNATKTSVSDCYAEEIPPMDQMQQLVTLLSPITDKILLIDQGNHEARTYRNDGIDLTALIAKQLGIFDRYVREGGVLFLRLGEAASGKRETNRSNKVRQLCYSIYATHGNGGGRKEGAKAIRLADLACIVDCDIYIHSHTHLPMIMKQSFYRVDTRNSDVAQVEKLFVNTAAQLNYGGYGQTGGFKPSSKANPTIYIDGTRKHFTARL